MILTIWTENQVLQVTFRKLLLEANKSCDTGIFSTCLLKEHDQEWLPLASLLPADKLYFQSLPMYHRLVNEDESEEAILYQSNDSQNNFELKNRHNKERRPLELGRETSNEPQNGNSKIDYILHTIKPNETLQGIALKYDCSVSKLRLHNNLMNDHTFHGLAVLKIPVVRNSILKEQLSNVIDPTADRTKFVEDLVDLSEAGHTDNNTDASSIPKTQVMKVGISNYLSNNSSDDYKKFLNNLGDDFKEIRKSLQVKMESNAANSPIQVDNDQTRLEGSSSTGPPKASSAFLSCDGSDFGISWRFLLIVLLIVCFLVPSYVLFFLEHHNSTSTHPDW